MKRFLEATPSSSLSRPSVRFIGLFTTSLDIPGPSHSYYVSYFTPTFRIPTRRSSRTVRHRPQNANHIWLWMPFSPFLAVSLPNFGVRPQSMLRLNCHQTSHYQDPLDNLIFSSVLQPSRRQHNSDDHKLVSHHQTTSLSPQNAC